MTAKKNEHVDEKPARGGSDAPAETKSNAARPMEGTGLGLGNPWDLAYGSNVPPERDNTPQPPAEVDHLGNMADPTPREEYTVACQVRKQQLAKEADK